MYFTRQRIQRQTPYESSATSENTGLFRKRRPFTNQDARGASSPHEQETPDLQTQLNRAARFSQHMSRVKVYGNRPVIQPKIAVGAPGDRYELEADQMADRVMSMAAPGKNQSIQREALPEEDEKDPLQRKPLAASITPVVQRETLPEPEEDELAQTKPMTGSSSSCLQRETLPEEEQQDPVQTKPMTGSSSSRLQRETLPEEEEQDPVQTKPMTGFSSSRLQREALPEEEEEQDQVQTKSSQKQTAKDQSFDAGSNVESQLNNSKGGGSPLPDEVRSFMEPRFGADLSQVRVHTGSEAVQMNKELNAQAFTHRKDIYFGSGRYNPGSSEGKHLLAHELTHVIQQTGAVQPKLNIGQVATEYKQDANQVIKGNASESLGSSQKVVQQKCAACQEEDKKLMRQENPTADKKKQDIDITVPTDTSTQLLAGVIFAEASPIKETRETDEERKAIGSVFLNAVKHTQDLCSGVIGKDLKKDQRDFICNIDRRELGDNLVDAVKIGSVAYGQDRWKRVMNGSQMLPANKLGDLNKFEKIFLIRAIKAAQAVIGGQEREYDLVSFSKYSSPPNRRMERVETLGQHTFFKFKKDLECGEWKENK